MMSVLVSLIVILMRATPSLRVVKRAIMPCLAKTSLASSFIASSLSGPLPDGTAIHAPVESRVTCRAPNGQARAPNGQEISTRSGVGSLTSMEAVARPASAHGACAWQQSCLRAPGVAPERKGRAAARVSETRRAFYSPLETRRTIFTGCATFVGRLSASRQVRAGAGREELLTALVSLATSQRTQLLRHYVDETILTADHAADAHHMTRTRAAKTRINRRE